MKIAVTYENGEVFQHFGHCENFRIYETEEDQIGHAQTVSAEGSGHGALAGFLKRQGVDALICGGIGGGARSAGGRGHQTLSRRFRKCRSGGQGAAGGNAGFQSG